jgi:hypothetical protein
MDEKPCDHCGKLISHGLLYGRLHFCNDECAAKFGIDPQDCFFGGVGDTTDYNICDGPADSYGYCEA